MKEIFFKLNYRFSGVAEDQWQDLFDSPACKVTKTEDDSYCLTACRLEKLTDYNSAVEAAKKLVTMLIAFTKIEFNTDIQRIEPHELCFIYSLRDDVGDKTNVFVFSGEVIALEASVAGGTVIIRDIDGHIVPQAPQAPQEHWFDYYLNQCDEEIDSTIFDVLADFAQVASWPNLQRILVAFELDINKQVNKMGWAKKGKRLSFYWSATHYDALEDAKDEYLGSDKGRHPKLKYEKMEKDRLEKIKRGGNVNPYPDIIHLPEAKSLIGGILKKWLEFKKPQPS